MKSANNELTTARNTPNPIVAAGKDDAPVSETSPIAPTSNHGLAVSLCCDSHHATMAAIGARNISIVMLTARFPRAQSGEACPRGGGGGNRFAARLRDQSTNPDHDPIQSNRIMV